MTTISGTRYRIASEVARQTRLTEALTRENTAISTGKRIQAPSDDVVASARISQLARAKADQTTWIGNADAMAAQATQVDDALDFTQTQIDRARDLMLQGGNATLNANDRKALAIELRGIVEDLNATMARTDSRGQPLFPEGEPLQVPISADVRVAAAISRDTVFAGVETTDGPKSLADIITAAAAALEEPDPTLRQTATTAAIADLGTSVSHLAAARADQGVRAARIDAVREQLVTVGTRQTEERSGLEDTDVAEALAKVSAMKLSLDAAQAVFSKINKGTLFDLLG